MKCPWCKYQKEGKCELDDCDFKDLPFEKEAIIERMKREADHVIEVRDKIADKEIDEEQLKKDMALIMDLSMGMSIMVKALTEDFGMTEEEVKNAVGFKKMSLMQKARLASKMAQLKILRKGNNGFSDSTRKRKDI